MADRSVDYPAVRSTRDTWGHKSEFILASIGLAVGLGNIWRFPYLCQKNGGGAFLVPYIIFMIIEGLPLFFIEFAVGQRFRASSVSAWRRISPSLRGLGWSCVVISFMLCIYYCVVLGWCTYYFFMSFNSELPWSVEKACIYHKQYETIMSNLNVYKNSFNASLRNETLAKYWEGVESEFPDCCVRDPSKWYFYQKALRVSPDIGDNGIGLNGNIAGCLLISWIVTYFSVANGIKSSGKVVYFTAVFPYIVLVIFFFRGITLEGAKNGVALFFQPDWTRLAEPRIWLDAATQIFFTLSLGFGALVAFASYNPVKNNVINDAYTVVFINCGTSIFAGVVVFSILGYRELKTGFNAAEAGGGPGLAFMAFPDAILLMDGSPFWAVILFLMLILLGIDSEFGTLESSLAPFFDTGMVKKKWKPLFTAFVACGFFGIGLCMCAGNGFYIFQIFDDYSVGLPLLLIAFFQCIGVTWIYGAENFANDIEYMSGSRPNPFWLICWKYVSPIALLIIFVTNIVDLSKNPAKYAVYTGCEQSPIYHSRKGSDGWVVKEEYPGWGTFLVVLVSIAPFLPVMIGLVIDLFERPGAWAKGFKKRLLSSWCEYLPDPSWYDKSRRRTKTEMETKVNMDIMLSEREKDSSA